MPKTPRDVRLSDVQLAVLRVLWARREATTGEVAADLAAERNLAPTTVATMLTRLEKRGVVAQRREGRALVYRATISEPEVKRSMVAGLIASVFRGDATALVAHLVQAREVAPGDLAKIRARLKEAGDE